MKKVNFKIALMGLLLTISFLLLGTEQANAQTQASLIGANNGSGPSKGIYAVPAGNFVDAVSAQALLQSSMEQLMLQMKALNGTPLFSSLERKYNYYNEISDNLGKGQTVAEAISSGLTGAAFPLPRPSTNFLIQIKQEAVSLLTF